MTTSTKAQQQTALGEGLALGAVLAGVEGVNGNKTTLELDFRAAWRDWPYASKFPAVKAGPSQDDVFRIMGKSANRSTPHVAEWSGAWPFVPVIIHDWSADELADSIHEQVPAEAWLNLVRDWLQRTAQ
jgi:hypothetical protein